MTSNLEIRRFAIRDLLDHVTQGWFAIPKLQREFVWDGPKAAKLLDSMLRGMPVGTIMVWRTAKAKRLYLRQSYHVLPPFNAKNKSVWFLIDGQQRVSAIHHAREGSTLQNAKGKQIDFSRVVLSLEREDDGQQIRYRKPVPHRYVSMADVLHPSWSTRLHGLGKRARARVQQAREAILGYEIPFMFIHARIGDIRETFLRINTQGMKITTADAIFTKAEELDLRDIRHEVKQHLDDGFADLPEMPILFAMVAVQGGKEAWGRSLRQKINQLEREARTDVALRKRLSKEWSRIAVCFGKAADFLRETFSVLSRDFLYSDYMLAMIALFYYWNGRGPSAKQKAEIRKWFWATTVGGRYTGRNFGRCIPQDLQFFKRLSANGTARFTHAPETDRVDVRKALYASRTGITTAVYCMLMRRGPVHLFEDGLNEIPVTRFSTRANRRDRHHIFPKAALTGVHVSSSWYNSIVNICLLTAEENQQIGRRRPRQYLGEERDYGKLQFNRKMVRHLIPVDETSGVWDRNLAKGFSKFMKRRTEMICKELEKEAGIRLFRREK